VILVVETATCSGRAQDQAEGMSPPCKLNTFIARILCGTIETASFEGRPEEAFPHLIPSFVS
jgi:hypothetical protein